MRHSRLSRLLILALALAAPSALHAAAPAPDRLTTELLEHTDCVWKDGLRADIPLQKVFPARDVAPKHFQTVEIRNATPAFGWNVNSAKPATLQTACQILVASSAELLAQNKGDLWDSGKLRTDNSVSVPFTGKPLPAATTCFWKVKTWDNHGDES
ncbi:MAG: hypothetical protein LBT53_09075, partial [Puniceicoccales bacterium]|nr:hypothetical protein [Puniceicoccales bacterium]